MIIKQKFITRDDVRKNKDTHIYLFGDNIVEIGLGGQAKEMRGEPNTIGIPTKWRPDMGESSFFNDKDFEELAKIIWGRFMAANFYKNQGKIIVIPEDGLGTGLAKLEEKAPKILEFINECIKLLEDENEKRKSK